MENIQEYQIYTSSKSGLEIIEELKREIKEKGLTIFCHINHAEEAQRVNLKMSEEQLLIFEDPKVGTYLMQENPLIGIELPLKILVWANQENTQIAFPNVLLWQKRFALSKHIPILEKLIQLLNKLIQQTFEDNSTIQSY